MWKWILQAAIAIGQSEWAKRQATKLIDKILNKAAKRVEAIEKTIEKVKEQE